MGDNIETVEIENTPFQYSMVSPETLTASAYSLTTFLFDASGSVSKYKDQLLKAMNVSIDACRKSPTAENMLVRAVQFNQNIEEIHGFIELANVKDYKDLECHGRTSLYDAVYSSIAATMKAAKSLQDQFYSVNANMFIITDGIDNNSTYTPNKIAEYVDSILDKEQLGFFSSVLIGVNENDEVKDFLNKFKEEAKIGSYISIGDISPGKLAHMANFISKSMTSSSQAVVNGSVAPTEQPSTLAF